MIPHEAEKYLNSFVNYELNIHAVYPSIFKLKRIWYLLELLGHPQKTMKFIHVAGTKGKGSTCAYAAHILKNAGYKVGLYTSPHLEDIKERIRILSFYGDQNKYPEAFEFLPSERYRIFSDCITNEEFGSLLAEIKPCLEKVRANEEYGQLSYYEVLTVLALFYFYRRQVDFVVLETGLGGRLDATNVVNSLVCGLTPMSLEHTKQLGATLAEIAREKVAIVKSKSQQDPFCVSMHNPTVVGAPQPEEAGEVIKKHCGKEGVKTYLVGRDIHFTPVEHNSEGQTFMVRGIHQEYLLKTKLLGTHQMINAATAVGLVESLSHYGIKISAESIQGGIADTFWPGRFEVVHKNPVVVLDGAHNPASCKKLAETLTEIFPKKKVKLVLGVSQDKDIRGVCRSLAKIPDEIILTKSKHPRAHSFSVEDIEADFRGKVCVRIESVPEAIQSALTKAEKDDVILVTGSIFVIGEARKYFMNRRAYSVECAGSLKAARDTQNI